MNIVIFAVLAFVLGCLTVLVPRPIVRTACLSWFVSLIFTALDAPIVGLMLCLLGGVLFVIELVFFREPKPVDDIGDRQTASATIEEIYATYKPSRDRSVRLAKAKLDAAKVTGDYRDISERDLELYSYASEDERRRLRREVIKAKGLGGLYGGSA